MPKTWIHIWDLRVLVFGVWVDHPVHCFVMWLAAHLLGFLFQKHLVCLLFSEFLFDVFERHQGMLPQDPAVVTLGAWGVKLGNHPIFPCSQVIFKELVQEAQWCLALAQLPRPYSTLAIENAYIFWTSGWIPQKQIHSAGEKETT